ncbi:hypothetical protein GYB61_08735 [bacterium]|nr:hypothetical protein [bacterium]
MHKPIDDAIAGLELDAQQQDKLRALVDAARRQQASDLQNAMDGALKFVPRLLRGPVKALFSA